MELKKGTEIQMKIFFLIFYFRQETNCPGIEDFTHVHSDQCPFWPTTSNVHHGTAPNAGMPTSQTNSMFPNGISIQDPLMPIQNMHTNQYFVPSVKYESQSSNVN